MAGTSVPSPTFGPNGFSAPDESVILAGVESDIQGAFGGGLDMSDGSPEQQLATTQTAIIGDKNDQFVSLTQQMDPAYSFGRFQDGIGRIYFMDRLPAQPTLVPGCVCIGAQGTVIPAGSLAIADDTNLYQAVGGGTIDVTGQLVLDFVCLNTGPISCPAGALTTIYRGIPGWDRISNPNDGVLGRNVENRQQYEKRRQASVAKNALQVLQAIRGNVLDVAGVLDCYATENDTGSPVTVGGRTIAANSVYVCVSGGDPLAVATAIWQKKGPGCAYTGNVTETVFDTSGYTTPPSYTVKFDEATPLPILFLLTVPNTTQVPSNALQLLQGALTAAFSGDDGGVIPQIGSTVFASRFYASIALLGPWAQIISLKIGSSNTPGATFTASSSGTLLTVSAVASGTLAVGQTLSGTGIPDGIQISSLGSGSGGTGTYNLSAPLTLSSTAGLKASAPNQDQVVVNINQIPTFNPADAAINLV